MGIYKAYQEHLQRYVLFHEERGTKYNAFKKPFLFLWSAFCWLLGWWYAQIIIAKLVISYMAQHGSARNTAIAAQLYAKAKAPQMVEERVGAFMDIFFDTKLGGLVIKLTI